MVYKNTSVSDNNFIRLSFILEGVKENLALEIEK